MDWVLLTAGVWIVLMGLWIVGWSVARSREREIVAWEEEMLRRAVARRLERDGE